MRSLVANTASSSAVTATAETGFSNGTFVVPDGYPKVGTVLRITAGGILSTTTGTQDVLLNLRFGTVAGAGPILAAIDAPALAASQTNRGWSCQFVVTFRDVTNGAGKAVSTAQCQMANSNTTGAVLSFTDEVSGEVTVDTVGQATTLTLAVDWVNASNSITLETWVVEARK